MGAKRDMPETVAYHPFERLKELMSVKGFVPSGRPVHKKQDISDEELFATAMKDVKEVKEFRDIPIRRKKPVLPRAEKQELRALRMLAEIANGKKPIALSDTQEYVEWINPDYSAEIVRKLHEGRFSVQDFLDLHGFTVEDAEVEVENFIKGSLKKGFRCVKIIHGRGLRSPKGPVLKDAIAQWLAGRYRKHVIAFVTARQCDGGLGAIYVMLKKGKT
ncbi:MAG: Smr/MutS family protein [Nitrospirota bacterium]